MIILAATPIGNLADVSRRLVEALNTAPVVAAEDTRTAQKLMAGLGVSNRPHLVALHDHNEKSRAQALVESARDQDVLVLSDAGMPTISDPGYAVVAAAIAADVPVTALPGPSAVLTALALSGLPTDRFTFEGFLPRKASDRTALLASLAGERRTMIFFESPRRVPDTIAAMRDAFGPDRRAVIARELTKLHEEVIREPLGELVDTVKDGVRGEIVLVVDGAPPAAVSVQDAVLQVLELVRQGSRLADASAEVAEHTGLSRRELYQGALAVRG